MKLTWVREDADPDPAIEALFDAMARADRLSRNQCPCGCFALIGRCTATPEPRRHHAVTCTDERCDPSCPYRKEANDADAG
jgi:hypothetical protein